MQTITDWLVVEIYQNQRSTWFFPVVINSEINISVVKFASEQKTVVDECKNNINRM